MLLFGGGHQRHGQFWHQDQRVWLVPVDALHQPPEFQATAAGHAQILQGSDHHRAAHQQGQVNTGNVLQQCGQRQDAQVPLKFDAFKALLQSQRGGCHLCHRQANALGVAGAARGEGDLCGLLRHPGPGSRHRQML